MTLPATLTSSAIRSYFRDPAGTTNSRPLLVSLAAPPRAITDDASVVEVLRILERSLRDSQTGFEVTSVLRESIVVRHSVTDPDEFGWMPPSSSRTVEFDLVRTGRGAFKPYLFDDDDPWT